MVPILCFFSCGSHESLYPLPESKLILSYYFSASTCTQFTVMCLTIENNRDMCYSQHAVCLLSYKLAEKENVFRVKRDTISPLLTTKTFSTCLGLFLGFCLGFFELETKCFIYLVKLLSSGSSCCFSQWVKSYLEFAKRLTISSKMIICMSVMAWKRLSISLSSNVSVILCCYLEVL